jgi:hypothetical protein
VIRKNGPPKREEPSPTPETGPNHKALADTRTNTRNPTAIARQLRARRAATFRVERLSCGVHADPWVCRCGLPDPASGYESAAVHLLELGLTPAMNHEGLRSMWRCGGQQRQAAELIAQRWEAA